MYDLQSMIDSDKHNYIGEFFRMVFLEMKTLHFVFLYNMSEAQNLL